MLRMPAWMAVGLCVVGAGCAAGANIDEGEPGHADDSQGAEADSAAPATGDDAGAKLSLNADSGTQATSTSLAGYAPPSKLGCTTRAQDILVFDFRSGWWAGGGGGGFFATSLPIVVKTCPGTTVDYHHFENVEHIKCNYATTGGPDTCQTLPAANTVQDIMSTLEHPSVADYTQLWILSGSSQDPSDIPVGASLFQGVLAQTTDSCIPMLVAAGDGFVTHAQTISMDLGMGTVFTEETSPPGFFSVSLFPAQASTFLSGSELESNVLFTGITSMADVVSSFAGSSKADSLSESVSGGADYQVIAHDGAGNATIAVGAAPTTGGAPRPFILDSGWQRTYALSTPDPGTEQYIHNIVMYLSLVGCKAAPIAQPK